MTIASLDDYPCGIRAKEAKVAAIEKACYARIGIKVRAALPIVARVVATEFGGVAMNAYGPSCLLYSWAAIDLDGLLRAVQSEPPVYRAIDAPWPLLGDSADNGQTLPFMTRAATNPTREHVRAAAYALLDATPATPPWPPVVGQMVGYCPSDGCDTAWGVVTCGPDLAGRLIPAYCVMFYESVEPETLQLSALELSPIGEEPS